MSDGMFGSEDPVPKEGVDWEPFISSLLPRAFDQLALPEDGVGGCGVVTSSLYCRAKEEGAAAAMLLHWV